MVLIQSYRFKNEIDIQSDVYGSTLENWKLNPILDIKVET